MQGVERLGGEAGKSLIGTELVLLQEIMCQIGYIVAALAQRRNMNAEYIEPIIEIHAERTVIDGRLKIFVRCGDYAHIDFYRCFTAYAGDLLLLQCAQQADLQVGGHFANLIKEDSAAVGKLKFARHSGALCTGECAVFIAEQLTLGKSLGDGSAVNGDERTIGTAALVVNCLGSLPTPLSPVISTVQLVLLAILERFSVSIISGLEPTISLKCHFAI